MKKLLSIIFFVALAAVAVAQTPQEIVSRMQAEMDKHDESEGIAMTMDVKNVFPLFAGPAIEVSSLRGKQGFPKWRNRNSSSGTSVSEVRR